MAAMLAFGSAAQGDYFGTGGNAFASDFVTISSSTNPTGGYGIVGNDYRMGTYEITNAQWNKFVAAYGTVTGDPATAYNQNPDWTGTNVPTNRVSWYEAAQMINWLNTSRGHHAAYKFTGQGTSNYAFDTWNAAEAVGGTNLYRHKDAFYYMPTEDEWVKAAYWNGTTIQTYANASPGDLVSGVPDLAKWNYSPSAGSEPWDVGSGTEELNGTRNMMGNIWEWIESPHSDISYGDGSYRGLRGGSYYDSIYVPGNLLASSDRGYRYPDRESGYIGFRIASEVPEPCSLGLLALGGLALVRRRKRGMCK